MSAGVVIVTGSSSGIGLQASLEFLRKGYEVHGFDIQPNNIKNYGQFPTYYHHQVDVRDRAYYPIIKNVNYIVNSAGVQTCDPIGVNLVGTMNITEYYGLGNRTLYSICNLASVSAHNGAEFGDYTASKGGVLAYTKWTAKQIAKYGATCNSLSFGGVYTELNKPVTEDKELFDKIMEQTPLKKWTNPSECADWIYFITVINRSCSGQDIIIDNMEMLNHRFIWPDEEE